MIPYHILYILKLYAPNKLANLTGKALFKEIFSVFLFLFILDNVQNGSHGWEGHYRASYPA